MKIVVCASISFTNEIKEVSEKLKNIGHKTEIPLTSEKIIKGELSLEEFEKEKMKNGDGAFRKVKYNVIKRYFNLIESADCVLVLNYDKNGIENYIGGNTFLEMGFAHVLDKKIFLLNGIPEVSYKDEIVAMQPVVLNGDLSIIG